MQPPREKARQLDIAKRPRPLRILNVAAYCRVSSERDEQESSIEMQSSYFQSEIESHPGWVLAGIYADRNSGKNTRRRPEFRRMMDDCLEGKIDLVLTKSVNRFGRNTLELLQTVDKLTELGIEVHFTMENIHSKDPNARLALTIFAALAQDEIENMSENIQWGIRQRFMIGDIKYTDIPCYGYRRDKNDALTIEPTEAAIIQRMYQTYLAGMSLGSISNQLFEMGIPSPSGRARWSKQSISYALSNEKYMGDVVMQKTMVKDIFAGSRMYNVGQRAQYVAEDNHDGIITKELFDQVQNEKKRRSNIDIPLLTADENDNDAIYYTPPQAGRRKSARYSSDGLSGLIVCGECDRNYRRITRKTEDGHTIVWRCANRVEHGNLICPRSQTITDAELKTQIAETLGLERFDEKDIRVMHQQFTIRAGRIIDAPSC